ncbi:unnamed protein product [Moneuplotes crassus]|uniref:Uncharacterized protein n=1 Tax=Euplotes crassus TaxID=5936 RepID=A0AAD1UJG8_EUPCR|nr:unnamed protein product [Moneuplotes crassus]
MTTISPRKHQKAHWESFDNIYKQQMNHMKKTRRKRVRKSLNTFKNNSYCQPQNLELESSSLMYPLDENKKIKISFLKNKNKITLEPIFYKNRESLAVMDQDKSLAPTASTKKLIKRIREVRRSRDPRSHNEATSPERPNADLVEFDDNQLNESDEDRYEPMQPALKNILNPQERNIRLTELKRKRQDKRTVSSFPSKLRSPQNNDYKQQEEISPLRAESEELYNLCHKLPIFSKTIYKRKESDSSLLNSDNTFENVDKKINKISFVARPVGQKALKDPYCIDAEDQKHISPQEFYKNHKKQGRYHDSKGTEAWQGLFPSKNLWNGDSLAEQVKQNSLRKHGILSYSLDRRNLHKSITYLRRTDKIFKLVDLKRHSIFRDLESGNFKG